MVSKSWFWSQEWSHVESSLVSLPTPVNITNWWSMGSMLGIVYVNQVITGLLMASYYMSGLESSFESVTYIESEVWYGWLWRSLHFNGASLFFVMIYLHVGRGLYFKSYANEKVWISGSVMLIMLMGIAFLGYVLPWGQMSYWGATVITNLLSAVPIWGEMIVEWVWGGFSVGEATISRFYMLHFLLPLVLGALIGGHLIVLHEKGSSNPVGVLEGVDKIPFSPYYVWKDVVWWSIWMGVYLGWCLELPWVLGESDNFIEADPLVTPAHIQPEWYFLFAYAVLRSVPNKIGGVVALLMSVLVVPLSVLGSSSMGSCSWSSVSKSVFWWWVGVWGVLSWCGGKPVEAPYSDISWWMSWGFFGGWALNMWGRGG